MKNILLFSLVCLLASGRVSFAENNGISQAKQDIKNKEYKILLYGKPLAGNIVYIHYKDKKIKLEIVAGCIVEDKQLQYWNDYNKTVQQELLEGYDYWKLIDEEIKKNIQLSENG